MVWQTVLFLLFIFYTIFMWCVDNSFFFRSRYAIKIAKEDGLGALLPTYLHSLRYSAKILNKEYDYSPLMDMQLQRMLLLAIGGHRNVKNSFNGTKFEIIMTSHEDSQFDFVCEFDNDFSMRRCETLLTPMTYDLMKQVMVMAGLPPTKTTKATTTKLPKGW